MEKKYKIDFINFSDNNIELVDNIWFQTNLNTNDIIDILESGNDGYCNEATSIDIIELNTLVLIEYSSLKNQNFSLKEKFVDIEKFNPLNEIEDLILNKNTSAEEMIFIQGIDFSEKPDLVSSISKLDFNKITSITEWGASGFWEKYFAGVAVNLTSRLIDQLKSIGIPKSCIKTYKLSDEIKSFISKEFKVHPDSLILMNISQFEDKKIKLEFRDIHNKYLILHDKKDIIDFRLIKL